MATLKARSGSALKAQIRYETPEGVLVDTSGFTARFQVRSVQGTSRVLIDTTEGSDTLSVVEPGHWRIFLGKTTTKSLPPTSRWELELVSDNNDEDVTTLASGIILIEPEAVSNVE